MNQKKSDEQILVFEPDKPEKSFEEGLNHYFNGNYQLAADYLLLAQQSGMSGPDIETAMGFAHLAMDQFPRAEAAFKEVLSKYPSEIDARLGLGEVYYLTGDTFKAEDCFRAVLSNDQENSRAWNDLGVIYHRQNNYNRAKIYYETAIEFGSVESRFHLGTILMEEEELEKAEEILTPLLNSDEYRSEAMLNIGYILLQMGKFDESLRKVTEAEKLMDSELMLNYSAGLAQYYNGRYYRALSHFEKALKINPKYFPAQNALQSCRSRLAMMENSDFYFDKDIMTDTIKAPVEVKPDDFIKPQREYDIGTAAPMISLLICVSSDHANIEKCLNKCLLLTYPKYEIIVLPDRPFENNRRGIIVHPTGKINGSMKRNIGAKIANGSILVFIEPDARPEKNWMTNTVRTFIASHLESVGYGYPFPCFITRRNELTSLNRHTIQTDSINEFLRQLNRTLPKIDAASHIMSPVFILSTSHSFNFLARFLEMQITKEKQRLKLRIVFKVSKQAIPIYQMRTLLDPGVSDVEMSF